MRPLITIGLMTLGLFGCEGSDSAYNRGYGDGYASGYNTTCNIRATLVHGEWDNTNYKAGYDSGYSVGAANCRAERQ